MKINAQRLVDANKKLDILLTVLGYTEDGTKAPARPVDAIKDVAADPRARVVTLSCIQHLRDFIRKDLNDQSV
jgi:hypothetical protein